MNGGICASNLRLIGQFAERGSGSSGLLNVSRDRRQGVDIPVDWFIRAPARMSHCPGKSQRRLVWFREHFNCSGHCRASEPQNRAAPVTRAHTVKIKLPNVTSIKSIDAMPTIQYEKLQGSNRQ